MKTAMGKSRKRTQAIAALIESDTIKEAAGACKITSRTLLNWLAEPAFREEYESVQSQLLEAAVNRLRVAGFDAGMCLHQTIKDKDAPVTAKVSAAGRILELLLKATEIADLSARLDRLEESMKADL